MTSLALVQNIVGIVRREQRDNDAAHQVLRYLFRKRLWFCRIVEDEQGVSQEVVVPRGKRLTRELQQELLPFDADEAGAS